MIKGIHHIAISTPNIEARLTFYRDVLGFAATMTMLKGLNI